MAFGGPSEYTGRTLKAAHQGKGIKDTKFVALAEHLYDTLEQLNLPDAQRVAIMTIVHSVKGSIVEHHDWIPAAIEEFKKACLRLGLPLLPDVPESAPSPAAVPETLAALMNLWVSRNLCFLSPWRSTYLDAVWELLRSRVVLVVSNAKHEALHVTCSCWQTFCSKHLMSQQVHSC